MENKVREISAEEGENLSLRGHNAGDEYVVILHMRHISTWDGFAEALGNAFQLPMRGEGVDGTADWMQDLSWIKYRSYKVILFDFFSLKDKKLQNTLRAFWEQIARWWERDVLTFCVGGERRDFQVYFVKNGRHCAGDIAGSLDGDGEDKTMK